MAKVAVNTFPLLRRAYSAAAENMRVRMAAAARKAVDATTTGPSKELSGERKDVYWMRDPKTGNWIPETHFHDVDVAELREKFLGKKADM